MKEEVRHGDAPRLTLEGLLLRSCPGRLRIALGQQWLEFATTDVLSVVEKGSSEDSEKVLCVGIKLELRAGATLVSTGLQPTDFTLVGGLRPFAFAARPMQPEAGPRNRFEALERDFVAHLTTPRPQER